MHECQLCGSCGANKACFYIVTKMSDWFLEQWIKIKFLCEIRKECKWHLRNALQVLWERSYKNVGKKLPLFWHSIFVLKQGKVQIISEYW
jgi:hypothetical protein